MESMNAAIIGGLLSIISALLVVIVVRTGSISKKVEGINEKKIDKDACHSMRNEQRRNFDHHFHEDEHVVIKQVS